MFGPMTPITERTRINNERQLNDARMATYNQTRQNRLAVLMQKLVAHRPVLLRPAASVMPQPAAKRA